MVRHLRRAFAAAMVSIPMSSKNDINRVRHLSRIRKLSRLLDNAVEIPGTGYRVGLDPLLGIIPGGGDAVSLGISGYILYAAWKLGASGKTLGTMAFNVGLDAIVGLVPVLGDVFDFAFKANARNLTILEKALDAEKLLPDAEEERGGNAEGE